MTAVDVAYSVTGSGPPVYMAHGIGARKEMWQPLVDGLADAFTCVVYDERGHGESPITAVPFDLDDLVDDLEQLRRRLGHDRIHVMGHSLGGQIGPRYALRFPDTTASVVALSTAAGRTDEDRRKLAAVIARMRDEGIDQVLPTLCERWFTPEFAQANPDAIDRRIAQVLDTPAEQFLCVFDIYGETEMAPWLNEVQAPTLVLTGEFDPGCSPRHNEFIHGELPNSELVILDGLRHSIIVEAPERVVEPVRGFLQAH
ncbi:MAG: alpha/beta fold hydrolase [Actinomycetota bacterium]